MPIGSRLQAAPTFHILNLPCCLVSQVTLLLLAGDSSDLACGVDPQMDVRTDKVLHCADLEVQPVPGGLLNWPALSLAECHSAPFTATQCSMLEHNESQLGS